MSVTHILFAAFLTTKSACAFSAFQPDCSTPDDHVTWVSPPSVRGTMDIIFSCFSILLLCTWAIQHLSVPSHRTHFWNQKTFKNKQYSAFLDDARFNYTKLKWMIFSVIFPEYIFSKALSENLAAHDSRRQFVTLRKSQRLPGQSRGVPKTWDDKRDGGGKDWSTTHGYFADMGGFILRFDVDAVKVPLDPHDPDEFERSLFKLNPDGNTPYVPQDAMETEARELKQCREGSPCKNHPGSNQANEVGEYPGVAPAGETLSPTSGSSKESHPLLEVVVEGQAEISSTESAPSLARLQTVTSPLMEELSIGIPNTLVNESVPTAISPANTVVKRHSFPMNSTSTSAVSNQQLPLSADCTATPNSSEHELQLLRTPESTNLGEGNGPNGCRQKLETKDRLVPHKTWKATWTLNSMQMIYAIQAGIVLLPDTTAEDLNDKSKGDALVKGLAVLHITWLVIQIIARGIEGIAITQLEIMVLGFSACAIVTYFLLWHKPQDVKVPIYIDIPEALTREQIIQLSARSPVATLMIKQFWLHGVAIRALAGNIFPWTPGIKFRIPHLMKQSTFLNPHLVGIGGGGALFGGVHIAAWNFKFPTYVEKLLWRISALYLALIPVIGIMVYCFTLHFTKSEKNMTDTTADKFLRPIGRVAIPLYLLARMYLLVEVFRCLAYPSPSTFQNIGWPSVIPHIN